MFTSRKKIIGPYYVFVRTFFFLLFFFFNSQKKKKDMESSMLFITERMPFKQSHFQMYFYIKHRFPRSRKTFKFVLCNNGGFTSSEKDFPK